MTMTSTQIPSLQVGIFANDLCISFRIIMQEVLDAFVFQTLAEAKEVHAQVPQEDLKSIYEQGIRSINSWDTNLKDRYRAQIVSQYRQITQLYRHIFIMYVEEMYSQSLGDVTVRVNIPSMTNMIYTFIRMACNNPVVHQGEYVSSMQFMGRVLFVESIIRRTLYELLVQQNNIKGVSVSQHKPASPAKRDTSTKSGVTVYSEEDVHSHDLAMGQPHKAPTSVTRPKAKSPPLSMQELSERLSKNSSSALEGTVPPMPSMHSSSLQAPAFGSPKAASPVIITPVPQPSSELRFFESPIAAQPQTPVAPSPSFKAPSPAPAAPAAPSPSPLPSSAAPAAPAAPAPPPLPSSAAPAPSPLPSPAAPSPSLTAPLPSSAAPSLAPPPSRALTPATASVKSLPTQVTTTVAPSVSLPPEPRNLFSIASKPTTTAAASEREPIFELASQFTAHKPHGESFPEARRTNGSMAGDVDSLQLLPSDQDYQEEVKRLFDTTTTNTITPFDSVTNIAGAATSNHHNIRKSLFFPPQV